MIHGAWAQKNEAPVQTLSPDLAVLESPRDAPFPDPRFQLLSTVNQFLVTYSDVRDAFLPICGRVRLVVPLSCAELSHHTVGTEHLQPFARYDFSDSERNASSNVSRDELALGTNSLSMEDSPAWEAIRLRKPVIVGDLETSGRHCETTREFQRLGLGSSCWIPLQTAAGVLGTFWVASSQPRAYSADDAELLGNVAFSISLALATQLDLREAEDLQGEIDALEELTNRWLKTITFLGQIDGLADLRTTQDDHLVGRAHVSGQHRRRHPNRCA